MSCQYTLLLLTLLPSLAFSAFSEEFFLHFDACNIPGNYTPNSTHQSNLLTLLSSLCSNGSISGFYKDTVGTAPDKIYGLVLCRGDTNATSCRGYLSIAMLTVLEDCSDTKDVFLLYDLCFLRYSNQSVRSSTSDSHPYVMCNNNTVSDPPVKFNQLVVDLMDMIAHFAAYNSSRRFITWETPVSVSYHKIYGLAQCIPDLSEDECYRCLQDVSRLIKLVPYSAGVRVIRVRCNFRFEVYPFYGEFLLSPSSPSPRSNSTNTTTTTTADREGFLFFYIVVIPR